MSAKTLPLLAVYAEPKWEFAALLPLFDPPRHDTKETVARCQEKGINVRRTPIQRRCLVSQSAVQHSLIGGHRVTHCIRCEVPHAAALQMPSQLLL